VNIEGEDFIDKCLLKPMSERRKVGGKEGWGLM
jgi:hypothetical protein